MTGAVDVAPATPNRGRLVVATAAIVAGLLVAAALWTSTAGEPTSASPPTFDFVIPAGSGERLAAGEAIDVLPAELFVVIGETIRITNDDTVGHALGPWYVGPGQTLHQRFATPGTLTGSCSVHPDATFTITVVEA